VVTSKGEYCSSSERPRQRRQKRQHFAAADADGEQLRQVTVGQHEGGADKAQQHADEGEMVGHASIDEHVQTHHLNGDQ
jgi:hypothetical protein